MIVTDLAALLADLGVPVLPPEEVQVPERYVQTEAGEKPKAQGKRGLLAYLEAHPLGFLQIDDPQPISAAPPAETYWVTLSAVAPTRAACAALAAQVRERVAGSVDEPGDALTVIPAQPVMTGPGVFTCAPTYALTHIPAGPNG